MNARRKGGKPSLGDFSRGEHDASRARPTIRVLVVLGMSACSPELPVVGRGLHVELATDRDDPVCGGTVAFMDHYVEAVASLLGGTLPERPFIRYEWSSAKAGLAERNRQLVITTDLLPHEHELAHAVHAEILPRSRPFLQEGLASLLDASAFTRTSWPEGRDLDALLEAADPRSFDYHDALFVVSQIVRDHGFEGLRELWLRIPSDASARRVRDAYREIFGRSMEALFEPIDGVPRQTCHFAVCVGEAGAFDDDTIELEGPLDCEDDANAVGPSPGSYLGSVWRSHVVDLQDVVHRQETLDGVGAVLRPCSLRCDPLDPMAFYALPPGESQLGGLWPGPARIEVTRPLEDLPVDEPGLLRLSRTP
jgi:hypothetical protein